MLQRTQNDLLHVTMHAMKVTCIVQVMQVMNRLPGRPESIPLPNSVIIPIERNCAMTWRGDAQETRQEPAMRRTLVVMGVSGCGKSEVGRLLAAHFGCRFVEGDTLHAPASIAKMTAGIALEDTDRQDWLLRLQALIGEAVTAGQTLVVACSALKRRNRQVPWAGDASLLCIHLQASAGLLATRMRGRAHFMPVALLESQLRDFEPLARDERGMCIDLDGDGNDTPQAVVARIFSALAVRP